MSALPILDPNAPDYRKQIVELLALLRSGGLVAGAEQKPLHVVAIVTEILADIAKRGDAAAAERSTQLDRAALTATTLRVPESEIRRAHKEADPAFLRLVRQASENIRAYQSHIRHHDPAPLVRGGRKLGVRYTPIDRVGVYVPGGRALYPSSVLMSVVPAQVASVPEIAICSPATGGRISDLLLSLCGELGVFEVWQLGGAVAIAAMAYGTESIKKVDKVVGPGNAFVAEAKRQLFGRVGIDSMAGPSEVLIVADDSARADYVAADLLAQAEHDPGSAVLLTPSRTLASAVVAELDAQLHGLKRAAGARASLARYGTIVITESLDAACDLANELAPEHLQIMTKSDTRCLARIRHAGAIFVGAHTPVPLGDYFAGPSHVLPTSGTAKFFGPLSVNDFLKATSLIEYDAQALREDSQAVADFATCEGLTAHAAAVRIRSE